MSAARIELPGLRPRLVRFRAMVPGDVPAVGAVERASYAYPWSEGIFRDCLRVGYLCRVAELGREIVAYGIAAMGAREAHILNLCVRSDLRGRNIGRQMLLLLLDRARQAGMDDALLEVRPGVTAPRITRQPVGGTAALGTGFSFRVEAEGTAPLRYQWQRNGLDIPGATSTVTILEPPS